MELKKSIKADLEKKKFSFFLTGLVIALLLVCMALELVGSKERSKTLVTDNAQFIPEEKIIQTEHVKEKQPLPEPQKSQTMIDIVNNAVKADDFIIDVDPDQKLEDPEIVDIPEREEVVEEKEIFTVVEDLPEFLGGEDARQKFLKENLVYPRIAREMGMEGRVVVGFVVEPDGRLTNFTILRSQAPSLDEEALRVAKLMPKWKAGKQRGKAVRVQYQMPITFTLY